MPLLKRIFKIIVMGLIILLILGCLGAFALAKWVNPNHFKPQIIAMVNQSTGIFSRVLGFMWVQQR